MGVWRWIMLGIGILIFLFFLYLLTKTKELVRWRKRIACRKCKLSAVCLATDRYTMGEMVSLGVRTKANRYCPACSEYEYAHSLADRTASMFVEMEKDLHGTERDALKLQEDAKAMAADYIRDRWRRGKK